MIENCDTLFWSKKMDLDQRQGAFTGALMVMILVGVAFLVISGTFYIIGMKIEKKIHISMNQTTTRPPEIDDYFVG